MHRTDLTEVVQKLRVRGYISTSHLPSKCMHTKQVIHVLGFGDVILTHECLSGAQNQPEHLLYL